MNFNNRGNFNNNNNFNNNPNINSENQVKKILDKINNCQQMNELSGLIYMLQCFQLGINQSMNTFNFDLPTRDQDLNASIVEKCLRIKQKNQEIRLKTFNLRGTLIRQMPSNRKQGPQDRKYQDILQQIRYRAVSLRQKIEKSRRIPVQRNTVVRNEELVQQPLRELNKATEWLQKQTIILRTELNLLMKTIPEDKSNDL